MKMNKNDLNLDVERKNTLSSFSCGCCGKTISSSDCDDDGYTNCCNKPAINKDTFIKTGLFVSIKNFLKKISKFDNEYYAYTFLFDDEYYAYTFLSKRGDF